MMMKTTRTLAAILIAATLAGCAEKKAKPPQEKVPVAVATVAMKNMPMPKSS